MSEKNAVNPKEFAEKLLAWYDGNARVLPWRETPTPYRVWVSEIMLQQTRVEAALPYFERFIAALPDVGALAAAQEEQLFKLWEGLGYYSRVRNLQKGARAVTDRFDGQVPASFEKLLELPGIGEYTAGAVASIAFNIPVPAVDGNVLRVLSRILASKADITHPETKRELTNLARSLIPPRAGDFNQALMELGALVCLPNAAPRCEACPVASLCEGKRLGIARLLPVKPEKKPRTVIKRTVLVILSEGGVLLHKREGKGLLAGMWEFPNADGWLTVEEAASTVNAWDVAVCEISALEEGKHIFTHLEWKMHGFLLRTNCFFPPEGFAWADKPSLESGFALPGAFKTYSKHLAEWLK